jgi:hypothetical protein
MNKKGDLLPEETAKIIIAVVCVVFLIILAYVLYSLFTSRARIEQARANLAEIENKMATLKVGESVNESILSPAGYILTSWPANSGMLPKFCADRRWDQCFCFCEYGGKENEYFGKKVIEQSSLGMISAAIKFYQTFDITSTIFDACNDNSICIKPDRPVYLQSDALTTLDAQSLGWKDLDKVINLKAVASFVQTSKERVFTIKVNDLLKYGKNIIIKKNVGGYEITV